MTCLMNLKNLKHNGVVKRWNCTIIEMAYTWIPDEKRAKLDPND